MTTYERRVIETRRVEFVVPARPPYGATWADVAKVVRAATSELTHGLDRAPNECDLTVTPTDEALVISYELSQRIDDKPAGEGDVAGAVHEAALRRIADLEADRERMRGKRRQVNPLDIQHAWRAWGELDADQQYTWADQFAFIAARLNGAV